MNYYNNINFSRILHSVVTELFLWPYSSNRCQRPEAHVTHKTIVWVCILLSTFFIARIAKWRQLWQQKQQNDPLSRFHSNRELLTLGWHILNEYGKHKVVIYKQSTSHIKKMIDNNHLWVLWFCFLNPWNRIEYLY